MPSSKNYVRDYKQEAATESPERKKQRAERNAARQTLEHMGLVRKGDGKDVDHRVPLSQGGSTAVSNLRVRSAHANRSYPRTKSGAIRGR